MNDTVNPLEKTLEKIRQLLALAEGTKFEAERDSALAKAQELMLKYAIDEAMLRQAGQVRENRVGPRDIAMPGKEVLVKAKKSLLATVVHFNRCYLFSVAARSRTDHMMVVGFNSDTEFVEMLYTSLLTQMTTASEDALAAELKIRKVNAVVFRNNFAHAFADRIRNRLWEADMAARRALAENQTRALTFHGNEVLDWIKQNLVTGKGKSEKGSQRKLDPRARAAGDSAGRQADLSGGRTRGYVA